MAQGTAEEISKVDKSITGQYLSGKKQITVPKHRRKLTGKYLEVKKATEHNLKNVSVKFPLGQFVCVTGVSGSGKSTLVNDVLYQNIYKTLNNSNIKAGKLGALTLGKCAYKIKGDKGRLQGGTGKFGFLQAKYKEPQKIKSYDFSKYSNGATSSEDSDMQKKKFDFKNVDFMDENDEFNPVQTDITDSKYLFDNQDAIIVNFKRPNNN